MVAYMFSTKIINISVIKINDKKNLQKLTHLFYYCWTYIKRKLVKFHGTYYNLIFITSVRQKRR